MNEIFLAKPINRVLHHEALHDSIVAHTQVIELDQLEWENRRLENLNTTLIARLKKLTTKGDHHENIKISETS